MLEIRNAIRGAFTDVYTPEAIAARRALAPLDDDRQQLMAARVARRAARTRDRQRLTFLDPGGTIGRTSIAVADARKGLRMFEKVAIGVLGVVENMSTYVCGHCGHEEAIFGSGGGEALAADCGVALLGRLPLDTRIRAESDAGRPTVLSAPGTPRARAYVEFARRTAGVLAGRPRDRSGAFPGVVVERAS